MAEHIKKRKDKSSTPEFRAHWEETFGGKDANIQNETDRHERRSGGKADNGKDS